MIKMQHATSHLPFPKMHQCDLSYLLQEQQSGCLHDLSRVVFSGCGLGHHKPADLMKGWSPCTCAHVDVVCVNRVWTDYMESDPQRLMERVVPCVGLTVRPGLQKKSRSNQLNLVTCRDEMSPVAHKLDGAGGHAGFLTPPSALSLFYN